MYKTNKLTSILTAAIGLFVASCGNDGTTTSIPFGNTQATSPFYVTGSSPSWNQFYVSTTTRSFSLRMSEEVENDASMLDANIQVVSNYDPNNSANACGGTPVASTKSVNGSLIQLDLPGDLQQNTNYAILLYQGLKSVEGHTLLENSQPFNCFYINFSTSQQGGHSNPGKPTVTITRHDYVYGYNGQPCFGALLQFNETLAMQPTVLMEYRREEFGPKITANVYAYPINTFDNSIWQADLCDTISMFSELKVKVPTYTDQDEGLSGDPAEESFTVILGK